MEWYILAFIASFIGLGISSLLYMFSKTFGSSQLEVLSKRELAFAISSVLLIGFLIPLIMFSIEIEKTVLSEVSKQFFKNVGSVRFVDLNGDKITFSPEVVRKEHPIKSVIYFMNGFMSCFGDYATQAYIINGILNMVNFSIDTWMSMPLSSVAGKLIDLINVILYNYYLVSFIFKALAFSLDFMKDISLTILLPAGIILRSFPPTRGAGAYLLGFTLGFYLVFPFVYLLLAFSFPYPIFCSTEFSFHFEQFSAPINIDLVGYIRAYINAFKNEILRVLEMGKNVMIGVYSAVCFLPFISFSILLTFVQMSSGLFATNVPEFGRGFIKLI